MNRIETFIIILVIGSLWGFLEMTMLPVSILCAIGLFFLVLSRKLVDVPGTSVILGLIVCFYKTYSDHFFICQWAGVMALAGSFDLYTSLIFKTNWQKPINTAAIGFFTNLTALVIFVLSVTFIFKEPNWVSGGMERIINYSLISILPAALLSGFITANLGLLAGSRLNAIHTSVYKKLYPMVYLTAAILLWMAASIN